jgi:hypothetical protein
MFLLAWEENKGFHIDLHRLSDSDLELMLEWRNERVEEENAKHKSPGL